MFTLRQYLSICMRKTGNNYRTSFMKVVIRVFDLQNKENVSTEPYFLHTSFVPSSIPLTVIYFLNIYLCSTLSSYLFYYSLPFQSLFLCFHFYHSFFHYFFIFFRFPLPSLLSSSAAVVKLRATTEHFRWEPDFCLLGAGP